MGQLVESLKTRNETVRRKVGAPKEELPKPTIVETESERRMRERTGKGRG